MNPDKTYLVIMYDDKSGPATVMEFETLEEAEKELENYAYKYGVDVVIAKKVRRTVMQDE